MARQTWEEHRALSASKLNLSSKVRIILLTMVLFLTAVAERFKWHLIKTVILLVALGLLLLGLYNLATFSIN